MSGTTVSAVRQVAFSQYQRDGVLTVFPGDNPAGVPFPIARVFTISGVPAGGARGDHAHRACSQLVVCLTGQADVRVDDGDAVRTVVLDTAAVGLLIPPGLWNVITFARAATVVAVFCDQPYDEADYIRDRAQFLLAKGKPRASTDAR